jgi:hypothetical protein
MRPYETLLSVCLYVCMCMLIHTRSKWRYKSQMYKIFRKGSVDDQYLNNDALHPEFEWCRISSLRLNYLSRLEIYFSTYNFIFSCIIHLKIFILHRLLHVHMNICIIFTDCQCYRRFDFINLSIYLLKNWHDKCYIENTFHCVNYVYILYTGGLIFSRVCVAQQRVVYQESAALTTALWRCFFSAGMCLARRCLTMDVSSGSTTTAFGRHVAIWRNDAETRGPLLNIIRP